MPTHWPTLVLPLTLLGCGDSLVSGRNLEDLISTQPPGAPAWELRWATGDGLLVDCPIPVDADLEVIVGQVEVLPEEVTVQSPPGWITLESSRYAVMFPALVDLDAYEPPETDDDVDGVEGLERGVWGISAPVAVVVAEGDLEEVSNELTLDGDEELEFDEGVAWARVIAEVVDARDSLFEATTPIDFETRGELETEGLPVTALSFARDNAAGVWAGEPFDGVETTADCSEFENEDDE